LPRLRLTAVHVERLPTEDGKRTDYADTICPGLFLRVYPSGKRTWSVKFWSGHGRSARRSIRVTLGTVERHTLQQARAQARVLLESGEPPVRAVDLTVGGLVERALGALDLAPSTREH
jgi:hypothetical protein